MDTRQYLISEIQRFYSENGRVPVARDMRVKYNYPGINEFKDEFGSWNNAIEAAKFKLNKVWVSGNKICVICGTKETNQWHNSDRGRICHSCYYKQKSKYMNKLLDIDSNVGKGFVGERIVAAVLGIKPECDCNRIKGLGHKDFDMVQLHDEKYGKIQVKTATLRVSCHNSLHWYFDLVGRCDTYVMLGFSQERKDVIKVWVIPSNKSIVTYKTGLNIILNPKNIRHVAREIKKYEVDVKPYNDIYHSMSLEVCDTLTKKDAGGCSGT